MVHHNVSIIALAAALAASAAPTLAQESAPSASPAADAEIVVTARKRAESLISVPVVVSAIPAAELDRRAINNLDGIARLVPQLIIAPSGGGVQGGNISIRGISGPDTNPFGDQAVSFNIDGFQISKAFVRRMTDVDIEQVEVLKGPQALFFGKNSPAGIISIRTADPTPSLQAKLSAGYEFYAREIRTEGYIAGPISETLGFRIAGQYSAMQGYFKESTPVTAPFNYDPNHDRVPRSRDFAVRGTLRWEPTDALTARLKLNYAQTKNAGPKATTQVISCPFGARQTGSGEQCEPGKQKVHATSGPVVGTLGGIMNRFGDGENYQHQKQFLGSLELSYALSDAIQLTSVTGYYSVNLGQCQNYEEDYAIILPSCNPTKDREFSQELRIETDYEGPVNFAGGLYFSDTTATSGSNTYLFGGNFDLFGPGVAGPTTPFLVNNYNLKQDGKAYSAYLQVIFKPVEEVEIDVGGRYSRETKKVPMVRSDTASVILDAADEIVVARRKRNFNDFSPEITLSYRPTDQLTVFGSYKHGFLSGGFNSSSSAFFDGVEISYEPQTIKGFEAGVKTELLDRSLRLNAAAYTYKVKDLQVTGFQDATATINNAGAVKIKGAEFDFNYRTPLEGLSFNGAVAYNDGKYTSFPNAPCYNGQTPALGCIINASGAPTQDLSGTRLIRAPKWTLNGGFNFETPISEGLKLGLLGSVSYNSSLLTDVTSDPRGRMKKYGLVDATLRLGDAEDRWEIAAIGRNLTNKYYWSSSDNVPFTGGGQGTAGGVLGDRDAALSRGREIMLRLSYKFK